MPRLGRPILDADNGYCLAPMEQGIRLTTGAEFAARDAAPTPVQFDRLMPAARELFALGEPVEPQPWLGARPCFADSRPVIGRAPRQRGLWLAYGHGHWGLTLGAGDRAADRRNDDRRDAVLRSAALQRGAVYALPSLRARPLGPPLPVYSLIVLTTLDSGRVLLLDENLSCARTMSSYFAIVVTGCFGTM